MDDITFLTNAIKPIGFVGAAVIFVVMIFGMYQEDEGEYAFMRQCLTEVRETGASNEDATQTCNCVKREAGQWFRRNPGAEVSQSVEDHFFDKCSGDYYLRLNGAAPESSAKPYREERAGGWGDDADNDAPDEEGSDWGRY